MANSVFQPYDYVERSDTSERSESTATLANKLFTDSQQTTVPKRSPQDDAADDAAVAEQGFPQVTVSSDGAADNQSTTPSATANGSGNDSQDSGALAVLKDLGAGVENEIVNHPGQVLENLGIGVVTAVAATFVAPEVLAVAGVAALTYAGYKLAQAAPGWIDDAKTVDDPQDHTAAQVTQANSALQGLGAGAVNVGAGMIGFGIGGDISAAITGAGEGGGAGAVSSANTTPDVDAQPDPNKGPGGSALTNTQDTPVDHDDASAPSTDSQSGTTTATDGATMPGAGAEQSEQEGLQEGDANGTASELRARTPEERAQIVNVLKNAPINDIHMIGDGGAMGKEFYVGKINTADGQSMDVIIRPINPSNQIDISRVSMAQTQANVDQVAGIASGSPETGLRELELNGQKQLVAVQEYAGKSLGANLREWGAAYGNADENAAVPNEDLTRLLQEHPALKEAVGNNFLQMLYQGNPDLAFLTNGAVRGSQAAEFSLDEPMQIPIIDSKLSFFAGGDVTDGVANPTFPAPDWGPNGVMGDAVPVIGEYAGRPLSDVSPALQTRAENLQSFFESPAGRQQLQDAGLSENEINAATARLQYLTSKGFPPQYGFMDPEFEEISGPLLSKANDYAMQRSKLLSLEKLLQEQERELNPATENS